jgi:hypothetical protein
MAYIIKVKRRVYKNIEKMPVQAQERFKNLLAA